MAEMGQNDAAVKTGRDEGAIPAHGDDAGFIAAESEAAGNAGEQELYTLKYLGEEIPVTREELIRLAQKGRDYDRIRNRAETLAAKLRELTGGAPGAAVSGAAGQAKGKAAAGAGVPVPFKERALGGENARAASAGEADEARYDGNQPRGGAESAFQERESGGAPGVDRESGHPVAAQGLERESEHLADALFLEQWSGYPDGANALERESDFPADATPERESVPSDGAMTLKKESAQPGGERGLERESGDTGGAARREREIEEFLRVYGLVEAEAIPEAVWREVGRGVPLLSAYQAYENKLLRAALAAERLARSNALRSAGSGATAGGLIAGDLIEDDWYKRD